MQRKLLENGTFSELSSVYPKVSGDRTPREITDELIASLQREYNILEIPTSSIHLEDDMWILRGKDFDHERDGEELELKFTKKAFDSLMTEVGINRSMIMKLPLTLIKYNFDKLRENGARVIIERDDSVVTNVFKINANFIPFSIILENLKGERFNQVLVCDSKFRLMYLTERGYELNGGSEAHRFGWIFDGINKKNASKISSLLGTFKLVCSNGMTVIEDATNHTYSREKNGDYRSGMKNFMEYVKVQNFDSIAEKVIDSQRRLMEVDPSNGEIIDVYRACKNSVHESFGDQVIGWSVDERKDHIKKSKIRSERIQFLKERNDSYGNTFQVLNRITDLGKSNSVAAQIDLQDFIGLFARRALN